MLKALGRIKKKMRFKFVFEPVHMINCTDTGQQSIPKMTPSHRKGTIARLFFGTRDLKCNGQIRREAVFSFVDTRLKIWRQITRRKWKALKAWTMSLKKSSSRLGANGVTVGEERHEYDWVVLELAGHICFEELEDDWNVFCQCHTRESVVVVEFG